MKDQTILIVVALICITVIQLFALSQGINGTLLITVVGVLCGLVGYNIKARKTPDSKTKN